jgi:lipopolysaccharide assembly protein A
MRVLAWAIRIALFVALVAFAAKNTDPVALRLYSDLAWQAPLIAVLLAFFAAGAALGLLAMLGTCLSQRREISRLRRDAAPKDSSLPPVVVQPPAAEG